MFKKKRRGRDRVLVEDYPGETKLYISVLGAPGETQERVLATLAAGPLRPSPPD